MAQHAVIVKRAGGWVAATAETADQAKALVGAGQHGLGAALRTRGKDVGSHIGGNVFVVEVVDGGSL